MYYVKLNIQFFSSNSYFWTFFCVLLPSETDKTAQHKKNAHQSDSMRTPSLLPGTHVAEAMFANPIGLMSFEQIIEII